MQKYSPTDAHNSSELDPCIAAENRLKKSVFSTKMRRMLVLLIILLCFLISLGLLIFLLSSGSEPSHAPEDNKNSAQPQHPDKEPLRSDEDYNSEEYHDNEIGIRKAADGSFFGETDKKPVTNPRVLVNPALHPIVEGSEDTPRLTSSRPTFAPGFRVIAPQATLSTRQSPSTTSTQSPTTFTPRRLPPSTTTSRPRPVTKQPTTTTTQRPTTSTTTDNMPTVSLRVINPVWVGEQVQPDIASRFAKPTLVRDEIKPTCFEHMLDGRDTGLYYVDPEGKGEKFLVLCDMSTNGGGWTVLQKRISKKVKFHSQMWQDYEKGFGDIDDSFWLGLAKMARLAPLNKEELRLRIELRGDTCRGPPKGTDKCSGLQDGYWWAEYGFKLGDASTNYVLHLTPALRGNLSTVGSNDDLFYKLNNERPFTTIDRDNDDFATGGCAQLRNFGGWWHSGNCTTVALNGMYGDSSPQMRYLVFAHQLYSQDGHVEEKYNIHPKQTLMMIRRMNLPVAGTEKNAAPQ